MLGATLLGAVSTDTVAATPPPNAASAGRDAASPREIVQEPRGVQEARALVSRIGAAVRASDLAAVTALVTADIDKTIFEGLDPRRSWPEGPMLGARGTEDTASLRYGTQCTVSSGDGAAMCIHELRLRFERIDGRLRLAEMSTFGW